VSKKPPKTFLGDKCIKCGQERRYEVSGKCVNCIRERAKVYKLQQETIIKNPRTTFLPEEYWKQKNPDYSDLTYEKNFVTLEK